MAPGLARRKAVTATVLPLFSSSSSTKHKNHKVYERAMCFWSHGFDLLTVVTATW